MPRIITVAVELPAPAQVCTACPSIRKIRRIYECVGKIADRYGALFEAFDGALDSTLVLSFGPRTVQRESKLTLVNVAASDAAGVSKRWPKYY